MLYVAQNQLTWIDFEKASSHRHRNFLLCFGIHRCLGVQFLQLKYKKLTF